MWQLSNSWPNYWCPFSIYGWASLIQWEKTLQLQYPLNHKWKTAPAGLFRQPVMQTVFSRDTHHQCADMAEDYRPQSMRLTRQYWSVTSPWLGRKPSSTVGNLLWQESYHSKYSRVYVGQNSNTKYCFSIFHVAFKFVTVISRVQET